MATDLRTTHFRFGNNSGTESTHGWLAAQDTNMSYYVGKTFLVRVVTFEMGGTAGANTDWTWESSKNSGAWQAITTTSSNVKSVANNCWSNGADCTQRLTGQGTFESSAAGCTTDGTAGGTSNDIAANGCSETEISVQIVAADVANGDTIDFRTTSPDFTITHSVTPRVTVIKPIVGTQTGGLSYAGTFRSVKNTQKYAGGESFAGTNATIRILKYFTNHTVENLSFAGAYSYVKAGAKAYTYTASGVKSFVGAISRLINNLTRTYSGALSSTGGIINKQITKVFSGALSSSGTISKMLPRSYSGVLSYVGTINKAILKTYGGALSFAGGIINKLITKTFAGVVSFSGAINKRIAKTYDGIASFSGGILNKWITKVFAGAVSLVGEYSYVFTEAGGAAYTYTADGVLIIAGAISRLINNLTRIYTGSVSTSGIATRLINNLTRVYSGVVSTAGTLTRLINNLTRVYSGVSTFAGSLSRQINLLTRTVSGAVSMAGEYAYDLVGQVYRTIYGEIGFTGVVTNDHEEIISITMPTPTLRRRTLQFIPEAFYFKVNPGDGGRFKGEIVVQDGIVPVPVPIVEDPEKMNQKEFEDWRNRTSRRR